MYTNFDRVNRNLDTFAKQNKVITPANNNRTSHLPHDD